jgi:hypothetical protein
MPTKSVQGAPMVTLVMSEWHEVERRLTFSVDKATVKAVYPKLKAKEILEVLKKLEAGNNPEITKFVNNAAANGVELDWQHDYDNWYSMNKGGYQVTYSAQADD